MWTCCQDWSLPLEKKTLKRHQVLHNLILDISVHLQMCTWTARSICSGPYCEACGCINDHWLIMENDCIPSHLAVLKLWNIFLHVILMKNNALTVLNMLLGVWACLLLKIRLLSHSPGNSVSMGLIKPSWSRTPAKDAYLESICSLLELYHEKKFIFWLF